MDGVTGHSPYTTALAEAIQKPREPVLDVFNQVGLAVDNATGGKQQPWVATSPLEGVFYFQEPAAAAPAAEAPVTQAALDTETVFWQTIAQSTNPAEFEEYLRQYPQGRFAGLARIRVQSQSQSQSQSGQPQPQAPAQAPSPPQPVIAALPSVPASPSVVPAAAPPPPRCGGNADEQVIEPVRGLYEAVNTKNIELYAAQWSDDAMYRDVSNGTVRTKADKIAERRAKFAAWEQVSLRMHSAVVSDRAVDNATINVVYSMTVKPYGKAPISQTNVAEKYIVVCGGEGRWLIRHNVDDNRSR
jgi:hypothetical protein